MIDIEEKSILEISPFGVPNGEKSDLLKKAVTKKIQNHYENCPPYRRFIDHEKFDPYEPCDDLSDIPFLPTSLFKKLRLRSCEEEEVVRVVKSSGTSSQTPSQIPLDNTNRKNQMRALTSTLKDLLGASRIPFVVCDISPKSQKSTSVELSARIAGMRGYLMAASEKSYVLESCDGKPSLDRDKFGQTVRRLKSSGNAICLFGYTYMVYQYVIKPLYDKNVSIDLPNGSNILHFGGWKKLTDKAVSQKTFVDHAGEVFNIPQESVRDIYGFTEQLGVIYPDDGDGIKRTPVFSEVIVRDPVSLEPVPDGETGLLEFITPLPSSYPGNAILMDDMGRVVTRKPSGSGRYGTGFEVTGRAEGADVRGCGDTLPAHMYESS